ncbi:AraC family transcriptional regulator [Polymorphobacter sp. PAMC 29334]|uniref:AraC family transcriptional regulator n=1 Tax=Polymorphobacter sp. PAMC 29334 TaxID=2862331 RepID=UPI001C6744F0|nr:AraC family transcriptional regulator [Polymorphobacter sp. PAMC 29334]QYE34506.1 AraC family transcriptional regulator [Polymorphobacter sp. PAMC 29334]
MDTPPSPRPSMIDLVDWIEGHLDEPLTLDAIASRSGLSPYHFSRMFTARMGRSVMAHVRGRRLVRAGQRLVNDPDVRLIDLAFDCGFESQEAFTRAFRRVFGVAPGRFRQGFALTPIEGQYPMTMPDIDVAAAVILLPDLVAIPAFFVAGPSSRFDASTKTEIPHLWSRLIGALPFAGQIDSWATFGVVSEADRSEGSFDYMAGVEIVADAAVPEGFAVMPILSATYAVFRIVLNGGPVHPQVKAAMAAVWGELIPASGLTVADSPDFERYDGKFAPTKPGATIDFHVPVAV